MEKRPIRPHSGDIPTSGPLLRKLYPLTICILIIGLMPACLQKETPPPNSKRSNAPVLRYDVFAPLNSLKPNTTIASGGTFVFPFLYSYLFVPDENGRLSPDLARKWTYNRGTRTWTIHLRNNARFHDQRPVTARDAKFSLEYYVAHHKVGLNNSIEQISALSNDVLAIALKRESTDILHHIWDIEIVPEPDNESPLSSAPIVGSGPFQLVSINGDRQVTLEANPDYYGGAPRLKRVEFYYQPDREKTWTRLLRGATDIGQELSPVNFNMTAQYRDRFFFDRYTIQYYTILLYNTRLPLFSDVKVRRALALGIDRKYIVEQILQRFGHIATGPMGVDSPYRHPQLKPLPFDPDRARQLLDDAGWHLDAAGRRTHGGRRFEFELLFYKGNPVDQKVAHFVQLCLYHIGITINLRPLDYDQLVNAYFQNERFQAVLTELKGVYREPGSILRHWSAGAHGKSYAGGFSHPEVHRMIDQAFKEKDPAQKKHLLQSLDKKIAALQPGTFLFQKTALDVMSRRIRLPHRFSLTYDGLARLKDATLNDEFRKH